MSIENQVLPIPEELNGVPASVLENYVLSRVKQFAKPFASHLSPNASEEAIDFAFSRACLTLRAPKDFSDINLSLKFRHRCRFLGCHNKNCKLCKNNPYKICEDNDIFDEFYADQQLIRSKCQAEITVELCPSGFGSLQQHAGLELQMSLIDGDSYGHGMPIELLKTEDGRPILASRKLVDLHMDGRLYVLLKQGRAKLPDLFVTIPCDSLMLGGSYIKSLRLLVRVVRRNADGVVMPVPQIREVVSGRFAVKPQAVIDGCRTTEFPLFSDDITKLRYIGREEAQVLRTLEQHMAPLPNGSPAPCISTVDQLKQLMLFLDSNPAYETQLKQILNMHGRNLYRWEYLKQILWDRVVYDDAYPRAWYADENMSTGLVFPCSQGQVDLDRPIGILQRVTLGNVARLEVEPLFDDNMEQKSQVSMWRMTAEAAWRNAFHPGWHIVSDQLEWSNSLRRRSRISASSYTSMGSADAVQRSLSLNMQPTSLANALLDPSHPMLSLHHATSMNSGMRHSASPQPSGHSTPPAGTPPDTPTGGLVHPHTFLLDRVSAGLAAQAPQLMLGGGGHGGGMGQRSLVTVTPGPTVQIVGHPLTPRGSSMSSGPTISSGGNSPFMSATHNHALLGDMGQHSSRQIATMGYGQEGMQSLSRRPSSNYSTGSGSQSMGGHGGVSPPGGISSVAALVDFNVRQQQQQVSGNDSNLSLKRGRLANIQHLSLPNAPDSTRTFEDMVQMALQSAANPDDDEPTPRPASRTQLYHNESHGRHTPRTRMGHMDSVSPGVSTPQNSISPTVSSAVDGGLPSPTIDSLGMRRTSDYDSHAMLRPPNGVLLGGGMSAPHLDSGRRSGEYGEYPSVDAHAHLQSHQLMGLSGGSNRSSPSSSRMQSQLHMMQGQVDSLDMPTSDFFDMPSTGLSAELQRHLTLDEHLSGGMRAGPMHTLDDPHNARDLEDDGHADHSHPLNLGNLPTGTIKEPPFKSDSFRSVGGGSEYSFRNDSFRNLVGSIISPMSPDRNPNELDNEDLDFLLPHSDNSGPVDVTFDKLVGGH